MKIELRNREQHGLGEFMAVLYIEGFPAGVARSEAGNVSYEGASERGRQLIARAEAYCKTLPPLEDPDIIEDGKPVAFAQTLETVIIDLDQQISRQLFLQKMEQIVRQQQEGHIILANRQHPFYELLPLPSPVSRMLSTESGKEELAQYLKDRIVSEYNGGGLILNRNIPEDICQNAGLKEEQYTRPGAVPQERTKPAVNKKDGNRGKRPGK